jgi:hypothetical protein
MISYSSIAHYLTFIVHQCDANNFDSIFIKIKNDAYSLVVSRICCVCCVCVVDVFDTFWTRSTDRRCHFRYGVSRICAKFEFLSHTHIITETKDVIPEWVKYLQNI